MRTKTIKTMTMEMKKNKYDGRIGMRRKAFPVRMERKADSGGGSRTISGYAAVFNNVDKARDMLVKGCFAKSIRERGPESEANDKILLLWQHDTREPIGRITRLEEDEKGLYFEAEIDDVEAGNRALKQLESGTLNQFSIGFTYVWDQCEWDETGETFIVKEVKLYEISAVSFGCNPETEYLGLKSADEWNDAYGSLMKDISDFSSRMPVRKQQQLQEIITKAVSLAVGRPDSRKACPPSERADKPGMFNQIKIRKNGKG